MLRAIFITLIAIIFSAAQSFAKSPPPGTGFQDVPTNVLILLDTSGSMSANIPSGDSQYPSDIAFDSEGGIFVAKYYDNIEKYDSSGSYVMDWGSYDYGGATDGKFKHIYAMDIDGNDEIYVSDYGRGRVQVFNNLGVHQRNFSVTTEKVLGLAVGGDGNIYVLNENGTIEKFDSSGTRLQTWSNTGSYLVASDSTYVYTTNYLSKLIEKYDFNGNLITTFSTSFYPYGIDVDSAGNMYVGDLSGHKIYKYDSAGTLITSWGGFGGSLGKFKNPRGITADSSDNIWVADYLNHRIQSPDGTLLFSGVPNESRLDQAKKVIKDLVSNSTLTDGANFGLAEWNSNANMIVPISSSGASSIYTAVDSLNAGGLTNLDDAMDLAESYFLGSSSPMDISAWCQSDLVIIISDGFWTDTTASDTAKSLYDNYGIKTFVVGFLVSSSSSGSANYITLSQNGGTYPDSPVFADNWQALYESVSNYILQVINSNLTFSAPTIMPDITGNDYILQATFKHKTPHQWKGSLNKYELNSDGSIGSLLWNAGELLALKAAADRQIWTVGPGLSSTDYNNFTTTNVDELRVPLLENSGTTLSDAELTSLIEFVRGVDSYSEFSGGVDDDGDTIITGERWKLADIYHSRAVAVGVPDAFTSEESDVKTEAYYRYTNGYNAFKTGTAGNRTGAVYAGSNGGMLHAFDSATGSELWAFIPPSVIPNFKDMISSTANKSESIYSVDGSPVVKDIYYGGSWKTILMSGLRQGGHSYFALDITDPTTPTHLFTFSHNKFNSQVTYWDSTGIRTDYSTSSTIAAEYDFSDLGESWSQPAILRLPVGSGGAMTWTAVFGGGFNSGTNPNYGAKLFITNLEDGGKIINKLDIADTIGANGIVNAVPPKILAITPDSGTFFQGSGTPNGAIVYFSDLEGKLWKVNLSDQGILYDTAKLFNAESDTTNTRFTFHNNTATVDSEGNLIQFYGTGDQQSLGDVDANIENRAYAFKDAAVLTSFPTTMSTISNMADMAGGACPTSSQDGWYFDLDANEKVAAKATVNNGIVLFPRYTPDASNICSSGSAKITEHAYLCGTLIREIDLGYGIPTEAIVYKNKIYIGISTDQSAASLPPGFTKQGNLIIGEPASISTGTVEIESWWENF